MGDFNINLLGVETCNYAHNFLLSLQSFSPKNTATLIDNILVNKLDAGIYSGNIVSDIRNFVSFKKLKKYERKGEKRCGIFLISQKIVLLTSFPRLNGILFPAPRMTRIIPFLFSITKVNKLLDKHAPYKTLSQRRFKRMQKPWITRGLRKSI